MLKKILSILLIMSMLVGVWACNNTKENLSKENLLFYDDVNVSFYNNAKEWMKEDFLHNNMPKGTIIAGESEYCDESSPKRITKIIETREQFDEAFTEFPTEINFEKEMIIVYIFVSCACSEQNYLEKIKLKDNVLHIEFNAENRLAYPDAGLPHQCCLVISMNKVEFEDIEVEDTELY